MRDHRGRPSILVLGCAMDKGRGGSRLLHQLQGIGEVRVVADTPAEVDRVRELLKEIRILILDPIPYVFISREMFSGTPLRFVTVTTSGFDHLDVERCRQCGIEVSNVPGYAREAVAEHAFALLLALLRKICAADRLVRDNEWDFRPFLGTEICGKTFGVIGLGHIGSRVAELAIAFGARVVAYDVRPRQMPGVEMMDLSRLLEESAIVSLHADLNPTSLNLMGREQFARMKRRAVFVNTARGRLVDEEALVDALQTGRIAGAALDVLRQERPGAQNPLLSLPQVVFSPHVAFCTEEGLARRDRTILENVQAYLDGEPIHRVDQEQRQMELAGRG